MFVAAQCSKCKTIHTNNWF